MSNRATWLALWTNHSPLMEKENSKIMYLQLANKRFISAHLSETGGPYRVMRKNIPLLKIMGYIFKNEAYEENDCTSSIRVQK